MPDGTVLYGSNNIYTVTSEGHVVRCRIKGKQLDLPERAYNPLAPGDRVAFQSSHGTGGSGAPPEGVITARLPRRNQVVRYNAKRGALQTLAANVDGVVAVASCAQPEFRVRFIDRVSIMARRAGVPLRILATKTDLGVDGYTHTVLTVYEACEYPVHRVSAVTGEGIDSLRRALIGERVVLIGRSGVGKSRLVNALFGEEIQRVSNISVKYGQGRHTTTGATLLRRGELQLIDTPGIRELDVGDVGAQTVREAYPEFDPFEPYCGFPDCRHLQEDGCAVRHAVDKGIILASRYQNYAALTLSALEQE